MYLCTYGLFMKATSIFLTKKLARQKKLIGKNESMKLLRYLKNVKNESITNQFEFERRRIIVYINNNVAVIRIVYKLFVI